MKIKKMRKRSKAALRKGSIYIAVTGTAILVSLIGFTAIHLSKLDLRTALAQNESSCARHLAQSGVEFALGAIDFAPGWRSDYMHGEESSRDPSGISEKITFRLLDNKDGDLADDATDPVEIQGIGRCGSSTYIYSVTYAPAFTTTQQFGPMLLRSFTTSAGSSSSDTIDDTKWYGQYFLPDLHGEAVTWEVTSVEVNMKSSGASSGTLGVSLHLPDGTLLPGTLLETIAIDESQLSNSFDWHQFNFSSVRGLDPNVGLCLALSTNDTSVAEVRYEGSGVTESNAHMLTGGNGNWTTLEAGKSLFYRIRGVYTTAAGATGDFAITPGSWHRVSAN